MLDLNTRIHLDEIKVPLRIHQEFDRSRILILGRFGRSDRRFSHLFPQIRGQKRRRGLLNQLLMPTLNRAIALAQMHRLPVRIRQNLKLDVPRFLDVFLDVNLAVAERFFRFVPCDMVFLRKRNVIMRDPHSATAAARHSLDDHRITHLARNLHRFTFRFHRSIRSRHNRDACFSHRVLRHRFIAHHFDGL